MSAKHVQTHTHKKESFTQLGPMCPDAVQRHIQYSIVHQTMVTNMHSQFYRLPDIIFSKSRPYILNVYWNVFYIFVFVLVALNNFHVNGRRSPKLPSLLIHPHSLKSQPLGSVLSSSPLSADFDLSSISWRKSGSFKISLSLYLLSTSVSQILRKRAGQENSYLAGGWEIQFLNFVLTP